MALLEETIARIGPLDANAMAAMRDRLDHLTKPLGSLGRLEELAVQLAGIDQSSEPTVGGGRLVVVAAGDHGVVQEGVSAYPSEVTGQMLALFQARRAAINIIARRVSAHVVVVDAGVASADPLLEGDEVILSEYDGVLTALPALENGVSLRIGRGTRNFRREPAMTPDQARASIEGGIEVASRAIREYLITTLVPGDMGIGNTTAASAIVAALTGARPEDVVGPGAGLDDEGLARKTAVIDDALTLHRLAGADGFEVLTAVGGFEIGVLVGVILLGAAERCRVVLDGVVSGAAALIACSLAPRTLDFLIAGHRSTEPAHHKTLQHLGLTPLLDLELHLGEGTGAALALPLLDAAAALAREMWTFEEAGVTQKDA